MRNNDLMELLIKTSKVTNSNICNESNNLKQNYVNYNIKNTVHTASISLKSESEAGINDICYRLDKFLPVKQDHIIKVCNFIIDTYRSSFYKVQSALINEISWSNISSLMTMDSPLYFENSQKSYGKHSCTHSKEFCTRLFEGRFISPIDKEYLTIHGKVIVIDLFAINNKEHFVPGVEIAFYNSSNKKIYISIPLTNIDLCLVNDEIHSLSQASSVISDILVEKIECKLKKYNLLDNEERLKEMSDDKILTYFELYNMYNI